MPPAHILNAPTKLMKELGYGEGYQYDHDTEDGFSGQNYFPDGMGRQNFYDPPEPASSARSPSGWNTGRSCARNGAGARAHGPSYVSSIPQGRGPAKRPSFVAVESSWSA